MSNIWLNSYTLLLFHSAHITDISEYPAKLPWRGVDSQQASVFLIIISVLIYALITCRCSGPSCYWWIPFTSIKKSHIKAIDGPWAPAKMNGLVSTTHITLSHLYYFPSRSVWIVRFLGLNSHQILFNVLLAVWKLWKEFWASIPNQWVWLVRFVFLSQYTE